MQLTNRGKAILNEGNWEGMRRGDNPFFTEGDKTYLQYDELKIDNAKDAIGGINTSFMWRGKTICKIRTEGLAFTSTEGLILSRIEGRTEITIEEE